MEQAMQLARTAGTITRAELNKVLVNCANNDMASARKDFTSMHRIEYGYLIVCDTKLGNVELRYNPTRAKGKKYEIFQFNTGILLTPVGGTSPKVITEWVLANYKIELVDTVVVD